MKESKKLTSLPEQVVEVMQENEMMLVAGGNNGLDIVPINNIVGVCTNVNTGSGLCSGANNDTGMCKGVNNSSGVCEGMNNGSGPCLVIIN